jgi:hypothetical protein
MDLYESNLVCHFFRHWGWLENEDKAPLPQPPAAMLGNMQNPFDSFFGDVGISSGGRFVLIEFKRSREGVAIECGNGNGSKADRRALVTHLEKDVECHDLSRKAHLCAYLTPQEQLLFEPYYQAAQPVLGTAFYHLHRTDFFMAQLTTITLYEALTISDDKRTARGRGLQIGVSSEQLRDYVKCMYDHCEVDNNSTAAFMRVTEDKTTNVRVAPVGRMLCELMLAFKSMEKIDAQARVLPGDEREVDDEFKP